MSAAKDIPMYSGVGCSTEARLRTLERVMSTLAKENKELKDKVHTLEQDLAWFELNYEQNKD